MDDQTWATWMYEAFARGGDDEQMTMLVVPGNPWSKSRPRFARGRTYQPRDDLEAERRMASHLARSPARFTGNVFLACHFYRSNYQRIDVDNLVKHVCDSATGVLWKDDSQVTATVAVLDYDPVQPRTVIVVGNHASSLARGSDQAKDCPTCGKRFIPAAGKRRTAQTSCSARCARTAQAGGVDLSLAIPCAQCGEPFRRKTTGQIVCSNACRTKRLTGRPRPNARPSRCTQCGAALTHRRGGRCRTCWRADPAGAPAPVELTLYPDDGSPS